jgi:hypothetical protein
LTSDLYPETWEKPEKPEKPGRNLRNLRNLEETWEKPGRNLGKPGETWGQEDV